MPNIKIRLRSITKYLGRKLCGNIKLYPSSISYLADIEPEKGVIKGIGYVKDVILIFECGVGSTVGSYKIYGLSMYGNKPLAFIVRRLDPVTIVGTILARIPLYQIAEDKYWNLIINLSQRNGYKGCIEDEVLVIEM